MTKNTFEQYYSEVYRFTIEVNQSLKELRASQATITANLPSKVLLTFEDNNEVEIEIIRSVYEVNIDPNNKLKSIKCIEGGPIAGQYVTTATPADMTKITIRETLLRIDSLEPKNLFEGFVPFGEILVGYTILSFKAEQIDPNKDASFTANNISYNLKGGLIETQEILENIDLTNITCYNCFIEAFVRFSTKEKESNENAVS